MATQKHKANCIDCGKPIWQYSTRCKPCMGRTAVKCFPTECKGCGKTFKPKRQREANYCSRECAFKHARDWANGGSKPVAEYKSPRLCKVWFRSCVMCATSFIARREKSLACDGYIPTWQSSKAKAAYQPRPPTSRQCAFCGSAFERKWKGKYCSTKCSNTDRVPSGAEFVKKKYGMTNREWNRVRLMVLKRDLFVCYICGTDTDESADVNSDLYPNAEHVVPVAHGGETTMDNLRCACRACNMAKGHRRRENDAGVRT